MVVDHDRCILCDRCVRSCSEVKPFKVIGHTGKGYDTRISFDLDALMRESSCVQCGECMTACPTGALSLRRRVQPRAWADSPAQIPQNPNTPFPAGSGFLTADEMRDVWLAYESPTRGPQVVHPFRAVPYAYLKWNEGAVRRWVIPAGEKRVICREGEYGTTAFLLQGTGRFHIHIKGRAAAADNAGLLARLFGRGGGPDAGLGAKVRSLPGNQLLLGEMACLTNTSRNASVVAEADPDVPGLRLVEEGGRARAVVDPDAAPAAVVYEITRNMLDMMQRAPSAREDIEEIYTARAIENYLLNGPLFSTLGAEQKAEAARFLLDARQPEGGRRGVEYRFVEPGEVVVAEGDRLGGFYIVRLGFLRVEQVVGGTAQLLALLRRNEHFGEGALLADDLRRQDLLPPAADPRTRAATVTAIDPSELIRIPGHVFLRHVRPLPGREAAPRQGRRRPHGPADGGGRQAGGRAAGASTWTRACTRRRRCSSST